MSGAQPVSGYEQNHPLVTVIIPVHNRFYLADEAIQTVIDQTHRPIELIVIDDCSNMPYGLEKFSLPGISTKIFRHTTNMGPGAARETGRLLAEGDYICYLDSDDLWHPQKIEKQVATMEANLDWGMCYCQSLEFSQLPITGREPSRKRSDERFSSFLPAVFTGRPWGTSACMWKKDATEKIGPWFFGWTWEDYEYDCRAGCVNIQIGYLPEILCYYRVNQGIGQLSQTPRHKKIIYQTESIKQMYVHLEFYRKLNQPEINTIFCKILYYQSMHLFYENERVLAVEMLNNLARITGGIKRITAQLIVNISHLFHTRIVGHLSYALRRIYCF